MKLDISKVLLQLLVITIGLIPIFNVVTIFTSYNQTTLIDPKFNTIGKGLVILATVFSGIIILIYLKNIKRNGVLLIVGSLILYFSTVLGASLGYEPYFNSSLVLCPLVFAAAYLIVKPSIIESFKMMSNILAVYIYGSIITGIFNFNWAFQYYTQGIIPGFTYRLHSLGGHANNLAAIALIFLLLNLYLINTTTKKIKYIINIFAAIITIILTQSKTVWIIIIGILLLKYIIKSTTRKREFYYRISVMLLSVSFLMFLLFLTPFNNKILAFYQQNDSLSNLTGRDVVWAYTLDVWSVNEFFGYGDLWNENMQNNFAILYGWKPTHSHNEFFQTLGESGIIGVIALVIYVLILIHFCLKLGQKFNFIGLSFLLLLLIRGISEPVFIKNIYSANFFIHFIIFLCLISILHNDSFNKEATN